jgi:hypothetical protein
MNPLIPNKEPMRVQLEKEVKRENVLLVEI